MKRHTRQPMATKLPGYRLQWHHLVLIVSATAVVSFFLTCLVVPGDIECIYYEPQNIIEEN